MAGILDELVVLLSLNSKPFKQGSKEVQDELDKTGKTAEKNRKKIEDEQKKVADSYGKVRDAILSITAAVVSAVAGGEFLSYLTKNDAAVGRLSKNLGMATEELSLWEGIFSRMGSSSGDADSIFRGINKILEDIKNTGGSEALTPLARVGLDIGKFANASTSASERVKMLSDALKKLTPQDAQYFAQQAGLSESATNALIQQRYALDDLIIEQKKMNVVSEQDKKLALEREKAWGDFSQTLEGVARKIINQISPALTVLLTSAQSFIQYIASDVPTATSLFLALGSAVAALTGFKIAAWASTASGAFGVMGTAAGALLSKLGLIAAALASAYEVIHLLSAVGQYIGISTREGIHLTPSAQARINAGEGGSDAPFKSGGTGGDAPSLMGDLERKFNLPSGLLDQMWRQESGRGKNMRSPAGAKGHFQFMDATAAQYGLKNPDNFNESATAAARYMHDLLSANNGNLNRALAAYNEGQGNLDKGRMPDETRKYISDITAGMNLAQNRGGSTGGGTTVTTGDIHVHTTASDMTGVGQDAGKAIRNQILVSQANYGVN